MPKQITFYFFCLFIFNVFANESVSDTNMNLKRSALYKNNMEIVENLDTECIHDDCYYVYELTICGTLIKKMINPVIQSCIKSDECYFDELFATNIEKTQNEDVFIAMNTRASGRYELHSQCENNEINRLEEWYFDRNSPDEGILFCRTKSSKDSISKWIDFRLECNTLFESLTSCTVVNNDANFDSIYPNCRKTSH